MAGIGFELKKLFKKHGLFAAFRAYGYAGIVCTGPMLLGVLLLLGVMFLCDITGGIRHSRELLVCMITYTLLASLLMMRYCRLSGDLQESCWQREAFCMAFFFCFPAAV